MKTAAVFVLLAIPVLVLGSQYTPILSKTPGFLKGNQNAEIQIQVVFDPMCGDCSRYDIGTWQTVESQILSDSQLKDKVKFRYIVVPLPWHITAHKVVQALFYTQKKGDDKAIQMTRYFLRNQDKYNEGACAFLSSDQIISKIAQGIAAVDGSPIADLISAMQRGNEYDSKTRQWAKFALGPVHTPETPNFLINWVAVDGASQKSASEWMETLRKLVGQSGNSLRFY